MAFMKGLFRNTEAILQSCANRASTSIRVEFSPLRMSSQFHRNGNDVINIISLQGQNSIRKLKFTPKILTGLYNIKYVSKKIEALRRPSVFQKHGIVSFYL